MLGNKCFAFGFMKFVQFISNYFEYTNVTLCSTGILCSRLVLVVAAEEVAALPEVTADPEAFEELPVVALLMFHFVGSIPGNGSSPIIKSVTVL